MEASVLGPWAVCAAPLPPESSRRPPLAAGADAAALPPFLSPAGSQKMGGRCFHLSPGLQTAAFLHARER